MTENDFETLSSPTLSDDASDLLSRWQAPTGWRQGRGCFGGMVIAAMIRAASATVESNAPLRSVSIALAGPVVPGDTEIEVGRVRDGSNTAVRSVELRQADGTPFVGTCVYGRRRVDDGDWLALEAPNAPSWQETAVVELAAPPAPQFTRHVEFRPLGEPPFSGVERGTARGWVRLHDPGPARDAAYLAALADCWWPTSIVAFGTPRPMASIHYMLQITDAWEAAPSSPVFHRGFSSAAHGGYCEERRELWDEDGRLLAINQQTIVLIA